MIIVSVSLFGALLEIMAFFVVTSLERLFGRIVGVSEMIFSSSFGSTRIIL